MCLLGFRSEAKLTSHKSECCRMVTKMPKEDKASLSFDHPERQMNVPFVIYADFECILEDVAIDSGTNNLIQKHIPCAGGYFIKSNNSYLSKFRSFRGSNCIKDFLDSLVRDCLELFTI